MTFDLFAWKSPRDLDADRAEARLESWQEAGGDPGKSPFEPSTDVGWFYRELVKDVPGLEASSDAVPNPSTAPTGGIGGAIAAVAWFLGIPLLSGLLVLIASGCGASGRRSGPTNAG